MKPVRVKPPSKKKSISRSWQYFTYAVIGLAILVVISVMLPEVDTSLDARGATYTPPPPTPRKESAATEDAIDENNPLEVLTRRLKQSLVQYRAGVEGSAEALVDAANELSTVYIHAKYYNEAITISTQTVTVIEEHYGASSLRLLPTLKLLTEATQLLDRWADSVSFLTYIESVMRAHYGVTHPDSISITSSILRMYSQLGDFQTANDVYRMNEALYEEELKAIASRKATLLAMQAAGSTGSEDSSRDSFSAEEEVGDVSLQIAHADREAIDLRTALADMSLIQGSIYRRLYATFLEGKQAEGAAAGVADSSISPPSTTQPSLDNEELDEEDEEEARRSFFDKKENMPLIREKAHHFFSRAVENFERVLGAVDELYESRPGAAQAGRDEDMAIDHVRHVSDTIFKLAQALQSFAHMRYQLERLHDDETLGLFQAVVQQSRRLDDLEGLLEQAAARDLQRASGALASRNRHDECRDDNNDEVSLAEQEEAVEIAEQNLQRTQKQHLAILTDLAVALNNLGSLYTTREQLSEAEAAIRESIRLREHVHEAADVAVNPVSAPVTGEIAIAKSSLAKVLYLRGEEDEAQREFRQALRMAERSHGKDHDLYHRVNAIARHTIPALSDESDLLEETEELYDYTE